MKRQGGHGECTCSTSFRRGNARDPRDQEILKIVLNVPRKQLLQDLSATAAHARGQAWARGDRVGVTGFCWGGSTTIQYAAHDKTLGAAVCWYGPPGRPYRDDPQPVTGFDVAKDITCPFLGLFGAEDTSPAPADVRKFEELLRRHSKNVEIMIYPGAPDTPFTPTTVRATPPPRRRMPGVAASAGSLGTFVPDAAPDTSARDAEAHPGSPGRPRRLAEPPAALSSDGSCPYNGWAFLRDR